MMGISASSFAQNSDPAAKKVLDGVSAKFKSFKSVLANFTYKVENAAGKTLSTKKGSVTMKGPKYRINFGDQQIWCDGKTVWNYDKNANEVTVSKVESAAGTITPQKLFTNFYDKDFLYKLNGEQTIKGKKVQEIELTPVDKTKTFFKVLLYVDKANNTITGAKLFEKAGNRYNYSVSNLNGKANIADAQFVFDAKKYPGAEVVDLR